MNSHCIHRIFSWLTAMLLAFGAMPPLPAAAHDGEDHGAPEPVVAATPTGTLIALSGSGALFDTVLKHRPFAPGETVELTFYLVLAETNRPVADAVISASLSEGKKSTTVSFAPQPGELTGAYRATLTPATAEPMSWLFDVTAGSDSDLIGIAGFQASPLKANPTIGNIPPHRDWAVLPPPATLAIVGVLLLFAAFVAGRLTARKGESA